MKTLAVVAGRYAVCRLHAADRLPAPAGPFWSLTRAGDELSLVCAEEHAPLGARFEAGWALLRVEGPLDFSLTGVLRDIAAPLADAGISIFAVSTFDTDYILVRAESLFAAVSALRRSGFTVRGDV